MRNIIFLWFCLMISLPAYAMEDVYSNTREPDRILLKEILYQVEKSINQNDLSKLLVHLDERAVLTFMTTDVAVGATEVRAYYKKMFEMPNAILQSHQTKVVEINPAIFHGDMAIAYGKVSDTFKLTDGSTRQFDTRWTATAMKKNDTWKVMSINFSVNPFKNNVLDTAIERITQYSIFSFLGGMLVAWLMLRFFMRKV